MPQPPSYAEAFQTMMRILNLYAVDNVINVYYTVTTEAFRSTYIVRSGAARLQALRAGGRWRLQSRGSSFPICPSRAVLPLHTDRCTCGAQ